MDFLLFLLVNATLFIRPAELNEGLASWPIYNVLILSTLAVAAPKVARVLSPGSVYKNPITACVLGLMVSIFLSHAARLDLWAARDGSSEFAKNVIYYSLAVAVLDSPARLRGFLASLVVFVIILTSLALAHYHGWVDIPVLEAIADSEVDPATGEEFMMMRLRSTGIFNDPNDLSLVLLLGTGSCLYLASARPGRLMRPHWLTPIGLFLYALTLTHSRGGFLALLAGMMSLFYARFGAKKAAAMGLLALPAAFFLFAGRQTSISTDDTGQDRIRLWSAVFGMLAQSPLIGTGWGRYAEWPETGQVAHNSFVHAYGELGLVGGTLFLGAFVYAASTLLRLERHGSDLDDELRRLRPFLLAMVASYVAGMMTISRNYVAPTYMVLALVTSFLGLAARAHPALDEPGGPIARLDGRLIGRAAMVSVAFLGSSYVFVKLFVRWGN